MPPSACGRRPSRAGTERTGARATADYALITGGARGIGRATAARLRAGGCRIVVFDRVEPEDPVDAFVAVDLADSAATAEALERVLKDRAITRLVNNVGAVRPALCSRTRPSTTSTI